MPELSVDEIQTGLDELTDRYAGSPSFVSVTYTEFDEFEVRFLDTAPAAEVQAVVQNVKVHSQTEGTQVDVPVRGVTGPAIREMLGEIGVDIPETTVLPTVATVAGGDQCRNLEAPNYYGTVSFVAAAMEFRLEGGPCGGKRCKTINALVSNNHVIGRSDAAQPGEVIWTDTVANVATLKCVAKFTCKPNIDFAAAQVGDVSNVERWAVREIGKLKAIRRPKRGESIQKFGARTQRTHGKVAGQVNIKVNGVVFRGVFQTSGGFGCPGDSGSAVIAANNDCLGLFSWADNVPCAQKPKGYFWPLKSPGTFAADVIVETETS